jgi:hydrogenase maturation protease
VTATTPTCGAPALLVLCLGNELMGDDGAGIEVGRRLRDLIDVGLSHGHPPFRRLSGNDSPAVQTMTSPFGKGGLRGIFPNKPHQNPPWPPFSKGGERYCAESRQPLRVEEAATDVLQLLDLWRGENHVWLVDALASGSPAGSIKVIEHDDVLSLPQRHATAHYLSVPECLRWLVLCCPELAGVRYRLWGIEVAHVGPRLGLSASVETAVSEVAQRVLEEGRALLMAKTESAQPPGRR